MLTGRTANVLLVEQRSVIASLRELDETITTYADPAPPADKLDPFLCSAEKLDQLVAASHGDVAGAIQKNLIGFSPLFARELAFRAGNSSLDKALHSLLESPPSPAIYSSPSLDELRREPGRDEFNPIISPIELEHLSDQNRTSYPGSNEAADAYFILLDERRKFTATKQKLTSHLNSRIKKQRTLVINLRRELEGFANAETHQRYGELLLANLHQIVKTESGFAVTDFYHDQQPTIEIPSANKSSPREAAEYYFKLARKARHGEATG
jgi:predicted ribosome quality control (RQC) complex YloA/Tae2 family protein